MNIQIYSEKSNRFVNASDSTKSLKNREGCKPANMQSYISFNINGEKINLNWKKDVGKRIAAVIGKHQHVKRVVVTDNDDIHYLNVATSDSINLANVIANVVLQKRKPVSIDDIEENKYLVNTINHNKNVKK